MKILSAVLLSAIILPAHAGIVIYGTRVIYPAEKKEVVVQLVNQGEQASLVQSWIDDGNTSLPPEKIQVPFMLTPQWRALPLSLISRSKSRKCLIAYRTTKKVCFI